MKCINCGQNFIRNYNRVTGIRKDDIMVCPHCGHEEIYQKKDNDKEKTK